MAVMLIACKAEVCEAPPLPCIASVVVQPSVVIMDCPTEDVTQLEHADTPDLDDAPSTPICPEEPSEDSISAIPDEEFVKCRYCARTFFPARVQKHETVCREHHERHSLGIAPLQRRMMMRSCGPLSSSASASDRLSFCSFSSRGSGRESPPGHSSPGSPTAAAKLRHDEHLLSSHDGLSSSSSPPPSPRKEAVLPIPMSANEHSPQALPSELNDGHCDSQRMEAAMVFDFRSGSDRKVKPINSALASRLAKSTLRPSPEAKVAERDPVTNEKHANRGLKRNTIAVMPYARARLQKQEMEAEAHHQPAQKANSRANLDGSSGQRTQIASDLSKTQPKQPTTAINSSKEMSSGQTTVKADGMQATKLPSSSAVELERARRRACTKQNDCDTASNSIQNAQRRQEEMFRDLQQQLELLKSSQTFSRSTSPRPRSRSQEPVPALCLPQWGSDLPVTPDPNLRSSPRHVNSSSQRVRQGVAEGVQHVAEQEQHVAKQEQHIVEQEQHVIEQEQHVDEQEQCVDEQEQHAAEQELHVAEGEQHFAEQEPHFAEQELHVTEQELHAAEREHDIDGREHDIVQYEQEPCATVVMPRGDMLAPTVDASILSQDEGDCVPSVVLLQVEPTAIETVTAPICPDTETCEVAGASEVTEQQPSSERATPVPDHSTEDTAAPPNLEESFGHEPQEPVQCNAVDQSNVVEKPTVQVASTVFASPEIEVAVHNDRCPSDYVMVDFPSAMSSFTDVVVSPVNHLKAQANEASLVQCNALEPADSSDGAPQEVCHSPVEMNLVGTTEVALTTGTDAVEMEQSLLSSLQEEEGVAMPQQQQQAIDVQTEDQAKADFREDGECPGLDVGAEHHKAVLTELEEEDAQCDPEQDPPPFFPSDSEPTAEGFTTSAEYGDDSELDDDALVDAEVAAAEAEARAAEEEARIRAAEAEEALALANEAAARAAAAAMRAAQHAGQKAKGRARLDGPNVTIGHHSDAAMECPNRSPIRASSAPMPSTAPVLKKRPSHTLVPSPRLAHSALTGSPSHKATVASAFRKPKAGAGSMGSNSCTTEDTTTPPPPYNCQPGPSNIPLFCESSGEVLAAGAADQPSQAPQSTTCPMTLEDHADSPHGDMERRGRLSSPAHIGGTSKNAPIWSPVRARSGQPRSGPGPASSPVPALKIPCKVARATSNGPAKEVAYVPSSGERVRGISPSCSPERSRSPLALSRPTAPPPWDSSTSVKAAGRTPGRGSICVGRKVSDAPVPRTLPSVPEGDTPKAHSSARLQRPPSRVEKSSEMSSSNVVGSRVEKTAEHRTGIRTDKKPPQERHTETHAEHHPESRLAPRTPATKVHRKTASTPSSIARPPSQSVKQKSVSRDGGSPKESEGDNVGREKVAFCTACGMQFQDIIVPQNFCGQCGVKRAYMDSLVSI